MLCWQFLTFLYTFLFSLHITSLWWTDMICWSHKSRFYSFNQSLFVLKWLGTVWSNKYELQTDEQEDNLCKQLLHVFIELRRETVAKSDMRRWQKENCWSLPCFMPHSCCWPCPATFGSWVTHRHKNDQPCQQTQCQTNMSLEVKWRVAAVDLCTQTHFKDLFTFPLAFSMNY